MSDKQQTQHTEWLRLIDEEMKSVVQQSHDASFVSGIISHEQQKNKL